MIQIYSGEVRSVRGPVMTPEEKSSRIALLSASLLTMAAIGCGSLGLWRMGTDLEWAGDFIVQEGFLSHWQVWIAAAISMAYTSWWLTRYAGIMLRPGVQTTSGD
jgi:hypothetical protein